MESMRPPETVILRRHRARSLLRSNAEWKGGWPHRPTLLSWKQSVFITDLKGELYQLTAGWRHEHVPNRILRICHDEPHGERRFQTAGGPRLPVTKETTMKITATTSST